MLATLLLACIAGVATHIPAGLGVLEAVFIALLGHRVPHAELLGALLAYRAMYFIGPLIVAGIAYRVARVALEEAQVAFGAIRATGKCGGCRRRTAPGVCPSPR